MAQPPAALNDGFTLLVPNAWLLVILWSIPAAGAVAVFLVRRAVAIRWIATATALVALFTSLFIVVPFEWRRSSVFDFTRADTAQMVRRIQLPGGLGGEVALDGLSFPMVILTALLFTCAVVVSSKMTSRPVRYFALILLLEWALLGSFIARDLPWICGFLAVTALLAALLLGGWSGQGGWPAAGQLTVHLLSAVACLAAVGTDGEKNSAMFLLAAGVFLVWLAVPPLHTWLVEALRGSPVPVAMLIGGLLPAVGGYGLFRIAIGRFQAASASMNGFLATVGLCAVLYGGLCALAQEHPRRLIVFTTIGILGYVVLAAAIGTPIAVQGAVFVIVAQGLIGSAQLLVETPPDQQATGNPATGEDSAKSMAASGGAWLAWIILPGFVGPMLVVVGVFQSIQPIGPREAWQGYLVAAVACVGLVSLSAAGIRMIRRIMLNQGLAASSAA